MSKKLAEKARLIQAPDLDVPSPLATPVAPLTATPQPEARSRTAPGSMVNFLAAQSSAVSEAEQLRERLKAFDGATVAQKLDPRTIRASRWANRHAASFQGSAYAELRDDIASSGGNVQAIKVRPLPVTEGGATHEVIFGHRRHRACLELGLPVLALVERMDDLQLFAEMDRENRARANLSPWEQGMMYRRALDEGLFPSQRRLAESLGVDVALVSKALSVARLPDAVVAAFESPLVIQYRWAQPLAEVVQKDPEGVLARAKDLAASSVKLTPREVLARLITADETRPAGEPLRLGEGVRSVVWKPGPKGRVHVEIPPGALSAKELESLREWLRKALAR